MSSDGFPDIAVAVGKFEGLVKVHALVPNAADDDVMLASLEFDDVARWVAAGPENAAAFVFAVQAAWVAAEQLIGERVEGGLPSEFTDGVLTMLRDRFR